VWGAAEGCECEWGPAIVDHKRGADAGPSAQVGNTVKRVCPPTTQQGAFCVRCGAWRGELGSEPTLDRFVAHLVEVFRAVGRVLRDDGLLFVNLGDSYLPDGNLAMAPAKFALAMQQPYARHTIAKETDRAWLAALVDGEGTVSIQRKESYESRAERGANPRCQSQHVPFLAIGNNDRELLDRCVEITGYGTVLVKREPGVDSRGINSRRHYIWRLETDKAIAVLRDIYPYLIAKRRQAILANTLDLSNKAGRALRGNKALPAEEQERRELLKTLINACNQREDGIVLPDWCQEPAKVTVELGWRLRSEITLCKTAPMPESVQGARWERCRVKTAKGSSVRHTDPEAVGGWPPKDKTLWDTGGAEWADCPGCPKCAATDGLVQRWGSGRPTSATEKLYVFAKGGGAYYYDLEGVRVANTPGTIDRLRSGPVQGIGTAAKNQASRADGGMADYTTPAGRNLWNYVMWAPEPLQAAHYAAYPRWLPRLAIQAGTSEAGCCPTCGAPWLRIVSSTQEAKARNVDPQKYQGGSDGEVGGRWTASMAEQTRKVSTTLGWRQSCRCPAHEPAPCTALDPFSGSGTTVIEANALGRHGIGVELLPAYVDIAHQRLAGAPLSLFAWQGQGHLGALPGEPGQAAPETGTAGAGEEAAG
jgi:hypothetical protein